MPLDPGKSKAAFSRNVATEVRAGKPEKQAVAIAYREAGEKNDMAKEDFAEIKRLLTEFFSEEAKEPEHVSKKDSAEARMDAIMAKADSFKESDHPRANDGKFGSGGSSSSEKTKTSVTALKGKLEGMSNDKLHASLKNPNVDPAIKKHIERELDDRASSGR